MFRNKKNFYDSTKVDRNGGKEYGSDIHAVSIRTNHIIWDMIKELDREELFGFYFTANISLHKTVIIMHHEDKFMLKEGREKLKGFHDISNVLLLTKVIVFKPKKGVARLVTILSIILLSSLGSYFVYIYKDKIFAHRTIFSIESSRDEFETENIEIDVKKLRMLKENFEKHQEEPVEKAIKKSMEMSVTVISSMVSDSEKEKYRSEDLVKNFKGKSGIKFVLKDTNMSSEDFNLSVKDLNSYVSKFLKDNNSSELLKGYSSAILSDKSAKKEDLAEAYSDMGDLYRDTNMDKKAELSYNKSLKLSEKLEIQNPSKYGTYTAHTLTKLAHIYRDSNRSTLAVEKIGEAESRYLKVVSIYRNLSKKYPKKFQKQLAWSLNMLSNFYHNEKADFKKSIKTRREALYIYQKLAKESPKEFTLELFQTFNSLAKSYTLSKRYKLAEEKYQKALLLSDKLEKKRLPIFKAEVYNSLAQVDIAQVKLKEAKKNIESSLLLSQEHNATEAEAKSNFYLGYISILENHIDEGMEYYLKSFNLDKRFDTAQSYVILLVERDRYLKAKKFFDIMLKQYKNKSQRAKILLMYGKFYQEIDMESAKEKFRESLELYQEISADNNTSKTVIEFLKQELSPATVDTPPTPAYATDKQDTNRTHSPKRGE